MAHEVIVDNPLKAGLKAQKRLFFKKIGPIGAAGIVLILFAVIFLPAVSRGGTLNCVVFTLASVYLLLLPLLYLAVLGNIKKGFNSIPKGPFTYSFTESGISWKTTVSHSTVEWRGFTAFYPFKTVWVLVLAETQFICFPEELLSEELRKLIREKMAGRVK